jgi:hypothetical protein
VNAELSDHLDLKDRQEELESVVPRAPLDRPVHRENLGRRVSLDRQDPREKLEPREHLENVELLDLKAFRDSLVLLEHLAHLE